MKKRIIGVFLCGVLAVSGALVWRWAACRENAPAAAPVVTGRAGTLILDAGHGGEDGGAVSITGAAESQINLAIVLKLDDVLGFCGVAPVLLRGEDVSLHDSGSVTLREKKVSDLQNRVEMVQEVEGGTLLSIHQNSYPDGRYHGAQIFYAATDGSMALAQHIQAALVAALQPDNSRQAKPVEGSVYLMSHISCPAVLVECGFLTNSEEEAMLRDNGYQQKLALVLASAWLTAPEGAGAAEG